MPDEQKTDYKGIGMLVGAVTALLGVLFGGKDIVSVFWQKDDSLPITNQQRIEALEGDKTALQKQIERAKIERDKLAAQLEHAKQLGLRHERLAEQFRDQELKVARLEALLERLDK